MSSLGVWGSECQRKGFHSVPPFVCDKALPLSCCVSPGETLTSLPRVLLGEQGGGQIQGAQLDLNAVISTGKEAKEEEIRAREEEAWCW